MDLSKVKLDALTVTELRTLKQRMEEDLRVFLQTETNFVELQKKYSASKVLVDSLIKTEDKPQQVMIPLSSSLFIPGQIKDKNRFIVDIGTGYFAERDAKQTMEYCDQTNEVIATNLQGVRAEIQKKKTFLDQININLQKTVLKSQGIN